MPNWWRAVLIESWRDGGFGLYVHWPFCQAKCPYCDFNSHVTASIDQRRWAEALAAEVRRVAALTPGRVLNSIFFGGGTPSLMHPATVEAVLNAAATSWTWANDIEITLEANPTSVDASRFAGYAEAGVNRVSLGVQALRDEHLRRLGRLHTVKEAMTALDVARRAFERVSFDLIYARQGQTLKSWEVELSEALALGLDHLSLYQLTIEPGTAFWDRKKRGGLKGLPDEDIAADMYEVTSALCEDAGLVGYEVSNHAKPGAESRHNLVYWRYGDWAGIGPGAHGRLTLDGNRWATEEVREPGRWIDAVSGHTASGDRKPLNSKDVVGEHIMMGLRISEGIALHRVETLLETNRFWSAIDEMVSGGFMWKDAGRAGVTPAGRLVLNSVVSALLPE